jgi:hypothetical protein
MGRRIVVYGHGDKDEKDFPTPEHLVQYIKEDVYTKEDGRYRFTQGKDAEVIVLSRKGLIYGHFEIDDKVPPRKADRDAYPNVKFVYLVRGSASYESPVPLSAIELTGIQFGKSITEEQFQRILGLAGKVTTVKNRARIPEFEVDQERLLCELRRRLGQSEFRASLLEAYTRRCAVTGCDATDALEAAHIDPYSGPQSNHPSNGLLLRADIHALFDLGLLAICPETMQVALGSVLLNTTYADLEKSQLTIPADSNFHPSRHALEKRWQQFSR